MTPVRRKKKPAARTPARRSAKRAAKKISPIPPGFTTVTPYMVCKGTAAAVALYTKAFGAKVKVRMDGPDGTVVHAELQIGDSRIMLGEEQAAMDAKAPPTIGGTPVHIFLYVTDVDRWFERAVAAGARPEMPPTNMFWGDRYAKVSDPFGHRWLLATHVEDVSPKEMARRSAEAMAQPG
jgi:PhnB protein